MNALWDTDIELLRKDYPGVEKLKTVTPKQLMDNEDGVLDLVERIRTDLMSRADALLKYYEERI